MRAASHPVSTTPVPFWQVAGVSQASKRDNRQLAKSTKKKRLGSDFCSSKRRTKWTRGRWAAVRLCC